MPLFDIEPGDNPRAFGTMTFGVEGQPPAFSVDTNGNFSFSGAGVQRRIAYTVGTGGDYATLPDALTAAGSTPTDLRVISALTMTGDITIPTTVGISFSRGGSITTTGYTLTVLGRLSGDRFQIFTGSGSVVLGGPAADEAFPEWWGAVPTPLGTPPTVDSGPAITSAVYAVKGAGGAVLCCSGQYKISTAIDGSNIQPSQSFHVSPKTVSLRGMGSRETYFTGGETGFGFLEIVGSNYIKVEGITMQATGTVQYGILSGRPVGNGSSGLHRFTDVHLYGPYTISAFFGLASEVCHYDGLSVYTTAGKPCVLAKDIGGWSITAKYTALSPTTPYGGGNGVNSMIDCQLQTSSANAADCALFLEFTQTFYSRNLYTFCHNATAHVVMQRRSHDATFVNMHQEYLNTEPWGIYYTAVEDSGVNPQFANQSFIGCRMYGIYSEDLVTIDELFFRGNFRATGAKGQVVDVYNGYRFDLDSPDTATVPDIAGTSQANLKYRIRNAGTHNAFGKALPANITVPSLLTQMPGARDAVETLTNKRINPRVSQAANQSSTVLDFNYDMFIITALAQALTITTSGTPVTGQEMVFRIKDDGTSRALNWAANFASAGAVLPAATVAGKTMYLMFRFNAATSKVDLLRVTYDPAPDQMFIANAANTPGTPTGGGVLYVESGALKYKGSGGTVTVLGAA